MVSTWLTSREWDTTPIRIDFINNFPWHASSWLDGQVELIADLAEQIEEQLGYPVIEAGARIPVPKGTPHGWNQDSDAYWRESPLPREKYQILVFYMNHTPLDVAPGGGVAAAHANGSTSFFPNFFLEPAWSSTGPNTPKGDVLLHEIFHLLGYVHTEEDQERGGRGLVMDMPLVDPWLVGNRDRYFVSYEDVDELGCAFPHPDFSR